MPPSSASVVDHKRVHGWQRELASAVRDVGELLRLLGLPGTTVPDAAAAFPLLVPRGFVTRMRPGDPRDPLLLQVLPSVHEDDAVPGYSADPLREGESLAAPGLVRKYEGRALLLVSGACAVHCRYCFRRDFPYGESGAGLAALDAALDVVSRDATLREVILSGGDPLLLDDVRLGELVERIEALPHVRRLRIHTRLPIVLPERVTNGLVALLRGTRLRCVVVVHANHPAEIDETVVRATDGLRDAGATLLNQSVLLAGVNDSVDVLGELSERLVEIGILPYYLHLLDRVRGAAHFDVAESRALRLIDGLRRRLPGYAVPRLAREVPGDPAKLVIG